MALIKGGYTLSFAVEGQARINDEYEFWLHRFDCDVCWKLPRFVQRRHADKHPAVLIHTPPRIRMAASRSTLVPQRDAASCRSQL